MRLFLDVDGVINAQFAHFDWADGLLGREEAHEQGFLGIGRRQGYTLSWSTDMVAELASLPVELWWATTWRSHATSDIASLIGWGNPAKVLHPDLHSDSPTPWGVHSIVWKTAAVRKLHERDPRPFIHVDDELRHPPYELRSSGEMKRDAERQEYLDWARSVGGLVIGPDPAYGISRAHIAEMRAHIDNHKGDDQ